MHILVVHLYPQNLVLHLLYVFISCKSNKYLDYSRLRLQYTLPPWGMQAKFSCVSQLWEAPEFYTWAHVTSPCMPGIHAGFSTRLYQFPLINTLWKVKLLQLSVMVKLKAFVYWTSVQCSLAGLVIFKFCDDEWNWEFYTPFCATLFHSSSCLCLVCNIFS